MRIGSKRFRGSCIGVALTTLSACGGAPPRDGGNTIYLSSGLSLGAPVRSLLDRRYLTVIRQQYDFSCGSAALASLLTYHYGDSQNEQSVFLGMWRDGDREQIRRLGFSLLDMKRYLAARSIDADGYQVTFAQMQKAALPGIALIDTNGYKHFVVVKGMERGEVLLGDPALGVRRITASNFAKMWNGVYFVINGAVGQTAAVFGAEGDWALAPKGVSGALTQPVNLQALALTRPLPGDF